jgi:hypothetical protein
MKKCRKTSKQRGGDNLAIKSAAPLWFSGKEPDNETELLSDIIALTAPALWDWDLPKWHHILEKKQQQLLREKVVDVNGNGLLWREAVFWSNIIVELASDANYKRLDPRTETIRSYYEIAEEKERMNTKKLFADRFKPWLEQIKKPKSWMYDAEWLKAMRTLTALRHDNDDDADETDPLLNDGHDAAEDWYPPSLDSARSYWVSSDPELSNEDRSFWAGHRSLGTQIEDIKVAQLLRSSAWGEWSRGGLFRPKDGMFSIILEDNALRDWETWVNHPQRRNGVVRLVSDQPETLIAETTGKDYRLPRVGDSASSPSPEFGATPSPTPALSVSPKVNSTAAPTPTPTPPEMVVSVGGKKLPPGRRGRENFSSKKRNAVKVNISKYKRSKNK